MPTKLTNEQRAALDSRSPGQPVQVEDEVTKRVFWLVAPDDVPALWDDYLRDEVQRGVEAVNRGELVEWDLEAIKDRARSAALL